MINIRMKSKDIRSAPIKHEVDVGSKNVKTKYLSIIKGMIGKEKGIEPILIAALLLLALMLRISFLSFESGDYQDYLIPWYGFIHAHGGFAALKYAIGNYTPFYFYFIALMTYIPLPAIVLFKGLSIFFDFVLAFVVYCTVKLKYQQSYVPLVASLLVLFAPTIFINSAMWSQCDSIYTAFAVAGLYFFMRQRPGWACFYFGLSLSFKPQAAFLFPLLLFLWLKKEVYIRHLVLIPVCYLLMIFPAFLLGRPLMDLLTIYLAAPGEMPFLTLKAPNFWQWFPDSQFSLLYHSGMILTIACAIILCLVVYVRHQAVSANLLVKLAFIFVLSVPFFLPEMHERYFYMADVISIIYACYIPRQFYLAIGVQLASLFPYFLCLYNTTVINLSFLAFVILGAMIITISTLVKDLYFTDCQYIGTQVEDELA
jgi:Predicted integral membrane protein